MSPYREKSSGIQGLDPEEDKPTLFQSVTAPDPNQEKPRYTTESLQDLSTSVAAIQIQVLCNPRNNRRTSTIQPTQPIVVVPNAVPRGTPHDTTIHSNPPPPTHPPIQYLPIPLVIAAPLDTSKTATGLFEIWGMTCGDFYGSATSPQWTIS